VQAVTIAVAVRRLHHRAAGQAIPFLLSLARRLSAGRRTQIARNWYDSVMPEDAAPAPREIDVSADPVVLAHARALLTSLAGPAMFFDADLWDVGTILSRAGETLNFSRPVAVLDLIPDEDGPWRIVASSMDAIPSGKLPGTVPPGPRRGGRPARQGGPVTSSSGNAAVARKP
jgi:S-adenosyl methyltransferase